jgi:hypothetical protein
VKAQRRNPDTGLLRRIQNGGFVLNFNLDSIYRYRYH